VAANPNILQRLVRAFRPEPPSWEASARSAIAPTAYAQYDSINDRGQVIISTGFDGEKNWGDMGPAKHYSLHHATLRARSWQAYLESEVAVTVLEKMVLWIIGSGLKLQCNPDEVVLRSEGAIINKEAFNELTERRFAMWAADKESSYNGQLTLAETAYLAYRDAKVGGDVLVILRYDGMWKVELVDGSHVCNPMGVSVNPLLRNGVEIDERGRHVAYHVRRPKAENLGVYEWEKVPAYSASTGIRTAYMVYGSKYRLNDTRGLPVLAAVLETLRKLDDYKEATLGSAQEIAKIVYQIIHQDISTGESPLMGEIAKIAQATNGTVAVDDNMEKLVKLIAATTKKQTYNMPKGSKMESVEHKGSLIFKEFYETNTDIVCSAVGIPPNVAKSIYNDSFSASRAATKDWEHKIDTERAWFRAQFYQPIYEAWLYTEVMMGKIAAPKLLQFHREKNRMGLSAYHGSRFTGPKFPHIDPVKEVKAEREKLGPLFAHIPLTTVEQATENLMGGDSDSNMQQASEELKFGKTLGLEQAQAAVAKVPAKKQPKQEEEEDEED